MVYGVNLQSVKVIISCQVNPTAFWSAGAAATCLPNPFCAPPRGLELADAGAAGSIGRDRLIDEGRRRHPRAFLRAPDQVGILAHYAGGNSGHTPRTVTPARMAPARVGTWQPPKHQSASRPPPNRSTTRRRWTCASSKASVHAAADEAGWGTDALVGDSRGPRPGGDRHRDPPRRIGGHRGRRRQHRCERSPKRCEARGNPSRSCPPARATSTPATSSCHSTTTRDSHPPRSPGMTGSSTSRWLASSSPTAPRARARSSSWRAPGSTRR